MLQSCETKTCLQVPQRAQNITSEQQAHSGLVLACINKRTTTVFRNCILQQGSRG